MTGKTLLETGHLLLNLFFALPLLFVLGGVSNRQSAKDLEGGQIEFAPSRLANGAWLLAIVYLLWYLFWACATHIHQDRVRHWNFLSVTSCAMMASILFSLLFSWPGSVIVSSQGLRQVYWFRKDKRIDWEEIVEINTGERRRMVTITGVGGSRIVHSHELPDRQRLLLELKDRCGDNLPPDFPREPTGSF